MPQQRQPPSRLIAPAARCVQGLATGLTGVVLKPTAGMLEFASKTVSGIGGGIKALGDEVRGTAADRAASSERRGQ